MNSTPWKEDSFHSNLEENIRSCVPLTVIESTEEERVLHAIVVVARGLDRPAVAFSLAEGLSTLLGSTGTPPTIKDPIAVLDYIDKASDGSLYVLTDAHDWIANPQLKRKLRDVTGRLRYTRKRLIITCPDAGKLPAELSDLTAVLELPPPNIVELSAILSHLLKSPGATQALASADQRRLLQAALGLSASQAQFVFGKAIVQGGTIDKSAIAFVAKEKARIIAQSKALQFCEVTQTMAEVAGLELLKRWLRLREGAFTQEARDYGLRFPKGIALIGIPGTGKSLTAKTIAGTWQLPLLRLDVGAVFNSLLGESEANLRRALRQLSAIAPCVLWVDELEKAFAHGDRDGGTSCRILGDFLFWMEERNAPVFVVATCNNVSMLPPELLRKGRFDQIFFLDLPTRAERKAIFTVHIHKRGRVPELFELDALARASQDFTGAEVEEAISQAMYVAFAEAKREFTTQDILAVLKTLIPLSKSRPEAIEQLRQWVREGRAQPASLPEDTGDEQPSPPLDVKKK